MLTRPRCSPWLASLALLLFVACSGASDSTRSSSSTNWLTCAESADCSEYPGATCSADGYCVDEAGERIPVSSESSDDPTGPSSTDESPARTDEPDDNSATDDAANDASAVDDGVRDASVNDDSTDPADDRTNDASVADDGTDDASAADDGTDDASAADDGANDDSVADDDSGAPAPLDSSPGLVTLSLEIEAGVYCEPPPYCSGARRHIGIMRLADGAMLRSANGPTCAPTPCDLCVEQPCSGAACFPSTPEVDDETLVWDGAYQEPGVCGTPEQSCSATRYAPPGRYVARMCMNRGTIVPTAEPDEANNTTTCELAGVTDCIDVEFDFPSDTPVVGHLPEAGADDPPAADPECTEAPDCGLGLECCDGRCVNTGNDPFNCGACGVECSGEESFCAGTCQAPLCNETCGGGEICCLQMVGAAVIGCVEPEAGTCPVGCPDCDCAAPDTPIATPDGERPIRELRVGDLVYSIEGEAIVPVPIRKVNRTRVSDHQVVHVELESGRSLRISARHPTADGRDFGMLYAQGEIDGVTIQRATLEAYTEPFTYDILPSSSTGVYFAAGVAIGSTLHELP